MILRRGSVPTATSLGLVMFLGLIVLGCTGDGQPSGRAEAAVASAGGTVAAEGAKTAEADDIYAVDAVDVALVEYAIGMPTRLPPGPTVLRLSNQGFEGHNLKLVNPESGAVLWETESDLNAGEARLVELVLEAGTYRMICDVAGHDTRGMLMTLTVQARTDP